MYSNETFSPDAAHISDLHYNILAPVIFLKGALTRYGEIKMGVCPRLEFDTIMFISCLGV